MWILRSCCYSRFAGVFQQFQILRPTRSIRCVRRAWAGSDLLGSVWALCVAGGCTQVLGCPPTDAHFPLLSFLQHVCSPSVPNLFTDLSRFCAPLQLLTDIPSYFSAWAAPAHIPKGNVGRSRFITWWKLKKALSSTHTLSCGSPAVSPCPCCSHASPVPGITACLAVGSPVGLGVCECRRAVGAGAVYYLLLIIYLLLPVDTDTRAPILTAAARLPGVQNQHLLKQSLGFNFHGKCS